MTEVSTHMAPDEKGTDAEKCFSTSSTKVVIKSAIALELIKNQSMSTKVTFYDQSK